MLLLGLSSSMIMLILPTWGDRITLYTTISLTMIGIILIDKIFNKNEILFKYLKILLVGLSTYIIICFISIYKINCYREMYIKEQLQNEVFEKLIKITPRVGPKEDAHSVIIIRVIKGHRNFKRA